MIMVGITVPYDLLDERLLEKAKAFMRIAV